MRDRLSYKSFSIVNFSFILDLFPDFIFFEYFEGNVHPVFSLFFNFFDTLRASSSFPRKKFQLYRGFRRDEIYLVAFDNVLWAIETFSHRYGSEGKGPSPQTDDNIELFFYIQLFKYPRAENWDFIRFLFPYVTTHSFTCNNKYLFLTFTSLITTQINSAHTFSSLHFWFIIEIVITEYSPILYTDPDRFVSWIVSSKWKLERSLALNMNLLLENVSFCGKVCLFSRETDSPLNRCTRPRFNCH